MRTLILLSFIFVISNYAVAEDLGSQPSAPVTLLDRITTIEGKGWSTNGFASRSFACQTAYYHAFEQLKKGMAMAKNQQLISQSVQVQGWPATIIRNWNQHFGRCTVSIRIEVPPGTDQYELFVSDRQH